ncbi:MAG: DUF2878 domain-containing protein [Desulfobacterales bacterium]|nr:DUF2878 domain-containing protein [Desulfobacterales bacterium]
MKLIINVAIYQIIWFICILGENRGAWFALPLLAMHLFITPVLKADLKMMALLLFTGLFIDGILHKIGFFSFNVAAVPIPFWLAIIWLGLAIMPHNSLAWLKHRLLLSAFFGALGGPLAYWAGIRMGAAFFNWPLIPSLIVLAIIWALLWPGIMYLAGIDPAARKLEHK